MRPLLEAARIFERASAQGETTRRHAREGIPSQLTTFAATHEDGFPLNIIPYPARRGIPSQINIVRHSSRIEAAIMG